MRSGFTFSIGMHALILALLLFGLPYFRPKPRDIPPIVTVDVVDLAKEATTNQISPANKVEKTPQEETPEAKPPPPREMPTPVPSLAAVDNSVPELQAPDTNLKKPLQALPELPSIDNKIADLAAPNVDLKKLQPKPPAPSFDSVLKNLAKLKPQDTPTPTPQQQVKAAAKPATGAIAQLSNKLTASDEDALRQQLSQCWNIPAGAKDAQNLVVELDVTVNPDRTVASEQVIDRARMASDAVYRAAALSAERALRMPQCMPLALPPEKYEEWKSMTLRFDPKEMLGQ